MDTEVLDVDMLAYENGGKEARNAVVIMFFFIISKNFKNII